MEEMNLELVSFELISHVGMARSLLVEAMGSAREENFEDAEKKMEEAESELTLAHQSHFGLIQQEANGNPVPFSIILMHAEDQLLTTETLKLVVQELVLTHKKYSK